MPRKAGNGKKSNKLDWKKKRRQEYLELKRYRYYIFCEGQQTEPQYFAGFKKMIEENPIYSYFDSFGNTDEAEVCKDEYEKLLAEYKEVILNEDAFKALFDYTRSIDMMLTEFCEACYKAIIGGEPTRVDQLVKAREHTVKRERSKIGNSAYKNQGRGKPLPNTFRWETVRTMVNEIRNPQ